MKTNKIQTDTTNISTGRLIMAYAWVALCLFSIPETASANALLNGLNWAVDMLTSALARSGAILALAILGWMAWVGRFSWMFFGGILIGMVCVFGGASIVDALHSATRS